MKAKKPKETIDIDDIVSVKEPAFKKIKFKVTESSNNGFFILESIGRKKIIEITLDKKKITLIKKSKKNKTFRDIKSLEGFKF